MTHSRWRDFEVGTIHGSSRPAAPSREQLHKIAEFFGYPADVLLQMAGYPTQAPAPRPVPTAEDIAVREVEDIFRRLRPELQAVALDVLRAFRQTIS